MIRAIKLPANPDKKIELVELNPTDADAYRAIVDGPLKVIPLHRPASNLYVNDDAKELALPLNERATHIAWVHNREMRGHNIVLGEAVLVGAYDRRTYERSVPRYYRNVIYHEGYLTVECRTRTSRQWVIANRVFADWREAYKHGAEFMHEHADVTELRVVPL